MHTYVYVDEVEGNLFVKYYHITKGNAANRKKSRRRKKNEGQIKKLSCCMKAYNAFKSSEVLVHIMSRRYTIFESNKSCIRFEK